MNGDQENDRRSIEDTHKRDAWAKCIKLADRYDALASKALKDSFARDRAESMARACRECAQEVGR